MNEKQVERYVGHDVWLTLADGDRFKCAIRSIDSTGQVWCYDARGGSVAIDASDIQRMEDAE